MSTSVRNVELLRNKLSGSERLGEEREAQPCSVTFEVANRALALMLIIGLLTLRLIRGAMFKDMVENAGQLMRRGRNRRRWAFAGPQATIITAQGRLRAPQRLRGQA